MYIRKDVLKLALPVVVEQTFIMVMGLVNMVMAGHIGKEVISAVGMVDSINNIIIAFFTALAIGGTVIVAQNSGRMDLENAQKAALNAIFSGVLIAFFVTLLLFIFKKSIVFTVFSSAEPNVINNTLIYFRITLLTYPMIALTAIVFGILRGAGDTKTPLKVTITMNIMNVFLSYVFIFGVEITNKQIHILIPSLGIRGAAYGIAIARIIGTIMIIVVFYKKFLSNNIRSLKHFRFDTKILKLIFGIGIPSSIESLMFNGGKLITTVFVVGMGTATIAANAIGSSIMGLVNIAGIALAIAAVTMVGQAVGRKDFQMASDTLLYLTKAGMLLLTVICVCLFPFASHLAAVYTSDPEVIKISTMLIRSAIIFTPPFWAISFLLPSGLKGGGDVKYTLKVSMLGMWIFRLGLGYLLAIPFKFGIMGIWMGMYIDWIVRGILFVIRFKKGKWIHEL